MKEGAPQDAINQPPTLEEIDGVTGREIEGILPTPEKFRRLERGTDFEVLKRNKAITSEQPLDNFFVFVSPSSGTETKVIEAPHWRVINERNVRSTFPFETADGEQHTEYYYEVNTKGVGFLKLSAQGINIEHYDSWAIEDVEDVNDRGYKVLGLISKEEAEGGVLIGESRNLTKAGLRTELYWAMAKINRLPFKGEMKTVEELKAAKVISPKASYHPYEVVRLFKTNTRIAEASESDERRGELFARAFEVFNRETEDKKLQFPQLEVGNPAHQAIFIQEFFRRMAQNMAILLNLGYDHGAMHSANITLAAEIADVGTLAHWEAEEIEINKKRYNGVRRGHLKDMRDICYDLRMLLKAARRGGINAGDKEELRRVFF